MKTIAMLAATAVAAIVPGAASAATYYYSLTGPGGVTQAKWEMPSAPTPDQSVADEGFAIERVSGTFPGATAGAAYLDFFSKANGGGLSISDADGPGLLAALKGAQLYTGTELAPVMRRGIYALTDDNGVTGYSLTVANQWGGVPEPATWALMILGFGAVGGAMRVRRTSLRYA